jgi:ligand-binding sensor domain-containing protein
VISNTGITNLNINSIIAVGLDLYAGTNTGLFKSTNRGGDWKIVSGLAANKIYSLIVSTSGSEIFAGTESGLYESMDNGTSWSNINGIIASDKIISTMFIYTTILYVGTTDGYFYQGTGFIK